MMYANALPDPEYQAEFYEGVALKRGLAWVVDTILTAIITALIVPFTAFTALFFLPLLYLTVNFAYRWMTLSGKSATFGMRLAAIEFRRADGQPFDSGTAALHTLGYAISMAFVLPQVLSIFMMIFGPRGQGLTDTVLGTVAVNRVARF
ncbi:RDD family protein (plasmid) [Pseudorhodobacter turbinis]|uniref:RDD family protein n=1 Tax=Pseudorhodobacter turbinis TaxID=2500533 RepID=A0A4P8EIH6_9RHOB|nr:RDD family protein [Pseudorhodobacter turbinis]QCO56758.1 RDD family protein [Pseudorhodobacter turbinis]